MQHSIYTKNLYNDNNQQKIVFILEGINRHLSKGTGGFTVLDNQASIEHILPQTQNEDWKAELGESLERTCEDYLHTFGNLILVTNEWNSTLSNSSFLNKKGILSNHALRINSEYFSQEIIKWDEDAIKKRANFLVKQII